MLRRVLLAFSVQNPRIGYCQSMNFLAAALLLALDRSEEKAFWVLVCLIDDGGGHPLQIRSFPFHMSPETAKQERDRFYIRGSRTSDLEDSVLRHGLF